LGGSGTVELYSAANNGAFESNTRVHSTATGSTLTIGPDISIQNATNASFTTVGNSSAALTIQGKVKAQSPGQTLLVTGSTVSNTNTTTGGLHTTAGELAVTTMTGNVNATSISGSGDLDLTGNYVFNQPVSVSSTNSSLTLRGTWDNESSITQSGGVIFLGGT